VKKGKISSKNRGRIAGCLFLLPWLIGFFAFTLYPVLYSVWLSLSDVVISPGKGILTEFVGLKWYAEAFTADATYVISLLDSLKFIALATPMIVVVALLLSLLINGQYRGRAFFRAVFFLPVIIVSGAVVSELLATDAAAVVDPRSFIVYDFLASLPGVLSSPILFVFDNIVLILWFSGVQMILFLAALQKIDRPLKDAAAIDGASAWQMFWKIYIPFLKPIILLNTVYTIVMLSGLSNNRVNGEIVSKMRLAGKMYGYSAALSMIYFVSLAVLLGLAYLILREKKAKNRVKR
jgi:ABC-type sugar transport system permease subunit